MGAPKGNQYAVGVNCLFKDSDTLQDAINKYFNEGVNTRDIIVGKGKDKQTIQIEVPTITGLCLYLGFESRQSFYDYEQRSEKFSYVIKKARMRIESHYEEGLQLGNTVGSIFALKNMGWRDRIEQDITVHQEQRLFTPKGKVKKETIGEN